MRWPKKSSSQVRTSWRSGSDQDRSVQLERWRALAIPNSQPWSNAQMQPMGSRVLRMETVGSSSPMVDNNSRAVLQKHFVLEPTGICVEASSQDMMKVVGISSRKAESNTRNIMEAHRIRRFSITMGKRSLTEPVREDMSSCRTNEPLGILSKISSGASEALGRIYELGNSSTFQSVRHFSEWTANSPLTSRNTKCRNLHSNTKCNFLDTLSSK